MIKKKLGLFITGALVAGLVACNNNGAMETNDMSPVGTVNVSDNPQQNGRGYGTYSRNMNNRSNDGANELRTAHRDPQNNITDNDNDFDFVPDDLFEDARRGGSEISSSKTDISSGKYPHTKAITIQEAKYKFVNETSHNQKGQKNTQEQNKAQAQAQEQQQRGQTPNEQQYQGQQQEQAKAPTDQKQANQTEEKQPSNLSQEVQQVIDLTNEQRRKNGLTDLKADTKLNEVAQKKSEDMRKNNYFSHTSPTYGSPFDMMRDFGVTYKSAGENIAQGQQSPQQVVEAWMNSEGHRKNILSKDFTHIGIGYDQNGHHWTQMFIGK